MEVPSLEEKEMSSDPTSPEELAQKAKEHPIGIVVTFLAGFLTISVSFVLFYFKDQIENFMPSPLPYKEWLLLLAFLLAIRHQMRVIFLDSKVGKRIQRDNAKKATRLLVPLTVMGGLGLTFFGYHLMIGSLFMVTYCIVFLVFWRITYKGIEFDSTEKEQTLRTSLAFGFFGDLACVAFWVVHTIVSYQTLERTKEAQLSQASSQIDQSVYLNSDGVIFILLISSVLIGLEFAWVHFRLMRDRFELTVSFLRS